MVILMLIAICMAGGCDGCCWGGGGCCWGYGCYPGYYGCYPYGYGCYPAPPGYWGGYCYDGYGYYGYNGYPAAGYADNQTPAAPAPARVVVKLPDDARFFIGDKAYSLDSTHTFETPKLDPNQTYEYTLKIEVKRAGQTRVQSKRVTVLAGKETIVEFDEVATVAAH
jgi:uncharacterized protein (TIGR03000 family)